MCRYTVSVLCFPSSDLSFVGSGRFVGMTGGLPMPPACERLVEKRVKEVAVENPLSRGGHTQVAVFGAFFKKRWQAWWLCPFWT